MKKVLLCFFGSGSLYGILLVVILAACEGGLVKPKKDKDEKDAKSRLSRAWRVDRVLANDRLYTGTEFANWQFDFRQDGTYTLSTGTQSGQGKWELDSNDQKLMLDKGTPGEITFTVLQVNDALLELENIQTNNQAGQVRLVFQLKPR